MGNWRASGGGGPWRGEQGWRRREEGRAPWPARNPGRYGRPPPAPVFSGQIVPRWERDFCTYVCSVPWRKLCETKEVMHLYEVVTKWDDSAGEEAFQKAKARYWARIHGQQCNIPLPDPDMYIDVVDHDAVVDPELVEDLYEQPLILDDGVGDTGCRWDSFLFADKPVPATGWGDADDLAVSDGCKADPGCLNSDDRQGTTWENWDAKDSKDGNWNLGSNSLSGWGGGGDSSWDQWQSRASDAYRVPDPQWEDDQQYRRRRKRTDHDYGPPAHGRLHHQYKEQCNSHGRAWSRHYIS